MEKSEVALNFSVGKFEKCYSYIKKDTVWNSVGEHILIGKDTIIPFCEKVRKYFDEMTIDYKVLNIIENNQCVSINGQISFSKAGKWFRTISACDVYQFDEDLKLISIYSYCIDDKKVLM